MAALLVAAVIIGPLPGTAQPATRAPIAVVVGATSPLDALDVDTLRDVYLRRQRVWSNGSRAMPVNLPADDPRRETFSDRVLGRRPRELVGYWNRQYFQGIRPPLVLRSPEAICTYLATEPAGVGYVPLDDVDEEACRVILVLQTPPP